MKRVKEVGSDRDMDDLLETSELARLLQETAGGQKVCFDGVSYEVLRAYVASLDKVLNPPPCLIRHEKQNEKSDEEWMSVCYQRSLKALPCGKEGQMVARLYYVDLFHCSVRLGRYADAVVAHFGIMNCGTAESTVWCSKTIKNHLGDSCKREIMYSAEYIKRKCKEQGIVTFLSLYEG